MKDLLSTGRWHLNGSLGGGIPFGSVVEIFGDPSTWKTQLAIDIVARGQLTGRRCAWVNVDWTFNQVRAGAAAVNLGSLILVNSDSVESIMTICIRLIATGAIAVLVIDSIAAMVTRDELEGEPDAKVNAITRARLLSAMMASLVPLCHAHKTIVLLVNNSGGETADNTPGGKAIREKSDIRIQMRPTSPPMVIKDTRRIPSTFSFASEPKPNPQPCQNQ